MLENKGRGKTERPADTRRAALTIMRLGKATNAIRCN